MVLSREPADTLLRRWGLATRLSRRHARRQGPLCLRRRNLRWRRASTEGRRRLSHVLRRSLIVRHESFQAGRPHGAPEGIVTAFKACRAFNGRLANADNKITHRALRLRRRPRARDRPSGRRFSDRPRRDARLNGVSGDAFANRPRSWARNGSPTGAFPGDALRARFPHSTERPYVRRLAAV
jgi:hypothetical protein